MAKNENGLKEAAAVFVWFAATLSLIFVAGVLFFQPWQYDDYAVYFDMHNYQANVFESPEVNESTALEYEPKIGNPLQLIDLELTYEPYFCEEQDYTNDMYTAEDLPPEHHSPFMAYSFFIPENEATYAKFHAERPDLDAETVVWMVNVHLHLPFFYRVYINEDPDPLLINSFYRLPAGFMPSNLERITHENCRFLATPETAAAFRRFRASAREAGFSITVSSAYRTSHMQQKIFHSHGSRDGRVMRPHHSEHQTGRAIDVRGPGGLLDRTGPTATGAWVAENAHLYGFIIRYRAEITHITGVIHEPWHITYVGTEISMYMHKNGILSLEEFVGRNPGIRLMLHNVDIHTQEPNQLEMYY